MSQSEMTKMKAALIGGTAAGVASAIPILGCLNCACCALVMGGGFLAVYLYYKGAPPAPQPPYGDGAMLGLQAGLFGAVATTIVGIPIRLISAAAGFNNAEKMKEALDKADLPPQVEAWITTMGSGGVTAASILFGLAVSLVVYTIFGMIGGLIGVAVLHKQGRPPAPPMAMPPMAPPPPPADPGLT